MWSFFICRLIHFSAVVECSWGMTYQLSWVQLGFLLVRQFHPVGYWVGTSTVFLKGKAGGAYAPLRTWSSELTGWLECGHVPTPLGVVGKHAPSWHRFTQFVAEWEMYSMYFVRGIQLEHMCPDDVTLQHGIMVFPWVPKGMHASASIEGLAGCTHSFLCTETLFLMFVWADKLYMFINGTIL